MADERDQILPRGRNGDGTAYTGHSNMPQVWVSMAHSHGTTQTVPRTWVRQMVGTLE